MTDKKITELTATTSPTDDDVFPIVQNVLTVPETKKISVLTLRESIINGGWLPANETWTYASASTFTVSGNVTAKYPLGTKIKLTNSTLKYFYVVGASYSSNTTITVSGGSDYSLTNTSITSPSYSYEQTPTGFPEWFNYTPIWTSNGNPQPSLGNGVMTSFFKLEGSLLTWSVRFTAGSTTTYGTDYWKFSLPVACGTGASTRTYYGFGYVRQAGTANWTYLTQISSDVPTVLQYFVLSTAGSNSSLINSTTPYTWANGGFLSWNLQYRI